MRKKYIFVDFDGTIMDHGTNSIPDSTKLAIELLQQNGHEIILSTGRGPSLLDGVDKILNIDSYIASNGRYVVHHIKHTLTQAGIRALCVDAVLCLLTWVTGALIDI